MVKQDRVIINDKVFIHTYSDLEGYGVEREGVIYEEAYDPEEFIMERIYTEAKLPEEEEE